MRRKQHCFAHGLSAIGSNRHYLEALQRGREPRPARSETTGWSSATSTRIMRPPSEGTRVRALHLDPSRSRSTHRAPRPAPHPGHADAGDQPSVSVPSSRISKRRSRSQFRRTTTSVAVECRTALVIASDAMRYAACSTAAGSGGRLSCDSTTVRNAVPSDRRVVCAARMRSASTSPSSSRAGEPRFSTMRRTSRMAALLSTRTELSLSWRAAGDGPARLDAVSADSATPVSRGPSPSWSSRLSRRRSSCWATTSRSRESCSCSRRLVARIAVDRGPDTRASTRSSA